MVGFWKRRGRDDRPSGRAGVREAGRFRPEVAALEDRKLQAVTGVEVFPDPEFLVPPNGRFVTVRVTGTTSSIIQTSSPTTFPETPKVSYQVTDEYRRIEPRGPVEVKLATTFPFELNRVPYNAAIYNYSFEIKLQADRSGRDRDGRQYSVLVAAEDRDNGAGTTAPVLVPADKASIETATRNQAARARLLKMLRSLPPLQGSDVNGDSFWKKIGFG